MTLHDAPRLLCSSDPWLLCSLGQWVSSPTVCLWNPSAFVCPFAAGHWPLAWFLLHPGLHKKPYMFLVAEKKLFTFFSELCLNAHKCSLPLGTYTIYSYDIFLYAHKCCAPNWRSFSGGEFISGHTKNKLKSTCHCLPLFAVAVCCLLFLLLSLYLFGPLISASILLFLFSWPRLLLCSYKCSLGSHWEHKEH